MARQRARQSRSRATWNRLITATLDVIHEKGFDSASTSDFAMRAEVSRGAMLHHFPTRADLIIAAMEELLEGGSAAIRDKADGVASGETSLEQFVDFLHDLFSGRFFYISLELINAARTDPELRERMIPVTRRFHEALNDIWVHFDEFENESQHDRQVILNLTVCMLRGMGVQTVLKPDPQYYADLLTRWKLVLPLLVQDTTRPNGAKPADAETFR